MDATNTKLMPTCALCEKQAWVWIMNDTQKPFYEFALCSLHAPKNDPKIIEESKKKVRELWISIMVKR